jgi:ATP-dependent helicase Lhr and Lhr-like helicase
VARARDADDWDRDLEAARSSEAQVARALSLHPFVSHLADYTAEMDVLDFEFRFERERVRVDVKEKRTRYTRDYREMWPEVPEPELFILDETAFKALMWEEGLGYLLIHDVPQDRWLVMGPWEIALGPRRRFQRLGDKGSGDFLKGKLLLDLRTASASSRNLSVDELLRVVELSRRARRQVEPIRLRVREVIPVVPRPVPRPGVSSTAQTAPPRGPTPEPRQSPRSGEEQTDNDWGGLSSELVASVTAKWGWAAPTEVQSLAFPAVLAGDNVLVLAPTAGGKTESALLPVLDLVRFGGWSAPSVIMVSPLKALLDDQLVRYRQAAALTGATVFAWHGDIGRDQRRQFRENPADILLTTPESLEQLLGRPAGDGGSLFAGVRAVIVDEVHSFVGTPRGGQLISLLERLDQRSNGDIQRIGLSATVGNPTAVVEWLSGSSLRDPQVIKAYKPMKGEELSILTYQSLDEVVSLIQEATDSQKALVFAPSRRRAEELAHALGVAVHHSSISGEGRARAVQELKEGSSACVVATASLEMGIDIGDIDLVVNDGAPSDPGSYLQRLGRAGRRTGNRRMVLTVGDADSLLLVLAVVARARRGDLEAVSPGRGARLVIGQQVLSLVFEQTTVKRSDVREFLGWSPTFRRLQEDIEQTIDHLISDGWLVVAGGYLVAGPQAHSRFGGASFVHLLATFDGGAGATVVDMAGTRLGSLDWNQVVDDSGQPRPQSVVLGGKAWLPVSIDRSAGTVTVMPAEKGRPPSWRGPSIDVGRRTWEAAREILISTEVPAGSDERTIDWLATLRRNWAPRLEAPVRGTPDGTTVDSFAGVSVHQAVLRALAVEGSADGPSCLVSSDPSIAAQLAGSALDQWDRTIGVEAKFQATKLSIRHKELCAPAILLAEAEEYHVDREGIRNVLELITRHP